MSMLKHDRVLNVLLDLLVLAVLWCCTTRGKNGDDYDEVDE